jgi:hypothetical protein
MLYPNATNTGVSAGTKLTPYSGNLNISTPGEVVTVFKLKPAAV